MPCQIRYLNSAGVSPHEVKGLERLAAVCPNHWLIFASFNYFPPQGNAIEIDAIVVTDEQVILVELKNWNGELQTDQDRWVLNGAPRGRSAVILLSEKARKIKGAISSSIPALSKVNVDHRVLFTGSADTKNLPIEQVRFCWTLKDAVGLATRPGREKLLGKQTLPVVRPASKLADFQKMLGNTKRFRPREIDWSGYKIIEQNLFVHPGRAWSEHSVEQVRDSRVHALLRLWDFSKLPVGLNTPPTRRLVAERELLAAAYLRSCKSWLFERNGILIPILPSVDEILTNHYEIFSYPAGWTLMRRYLERCREALSPAAKRDLATSVLLFGAELHHQGVAHRDLSPACFWIGSPTSVGATGFMSAQLPNETSVQDWLTVLRGYAPPSPEDFDSSLIGTAKQRDVFNLGLIIDEVLHDQVPILQNGVAQPIDSIIRGGALGDLLAKATAANPADRFPDATEMSDAFGQLLVEENGPKSSLLDVYETAVIPMVQWPVFGEVTDNGRCLRYLANTGEVPQIVKVWPGIKRGTSKAVDLAMLKAFDGAENLKLTPVSGAMRIADAGLSRMGPYLVCFESAGTPLQFFSPSTSENALSIIEGLSATIAGLHDLGCTHADLNPSNILVSINGADVETTVIDLFDLSELGDGHVRAPAYMPANWEILTAEQIDNFAVIKIAGQLLDGFSDTALVPLKDIIKSDLNRDAVLTLEPLREGIAAAVVELMRPQLPEITITAPGLPKVTLASDSGNLVVHREVIAGATTYWVASETDRLIFRMRGGELETFALEKLSFWDLSASKGRFLLPARITVDVGPVSGFSDLVDLIPPISDEVEPEAEINDAFSISELWTRAVELESELVPEVTIRQKVRGSGPHDTYQYETEAVFDFAADSLVELRAQLDGKERTIGILDTARLGETHLTVKNPRRELFAGNVVRLVDKRARISTERRQKAVERIVDGRSTIPNLLDYFDPKAKPDVSAFKLLPSLEQLNGYELNPGQQKAFVDLVANGPVSLLQGPPGTGKTKFIGALVHWLTTSAGAKRVLVASQSHEAVNNATEELIKVFSDRGSPAKLLRIGSKGISARIRPFHTISLREGYHNRFASGIKARLAAAAAAIGISRAFVYDLVDTDRNLGEPARKAEQLLHALRDDALPADERRRLEQSLRGITRAISLHLDKIFGSEVDQVPFSSVFDLAAVQVLKAHPQSTPADLTAALKLLDLSREWRETLQSGHRNFEEFLAKTRNIVVGTCVGLGQARIRLDAGSFDWVIVDEAARCTASELAVPLQLGRRVLLVGDHLQLPPMTQPSVVSELRDELPWLSEAEAIRSDFERVFGSSYGKSVGRVLHEQYRMAPKICDVVSEVFYTPHGVRLETSPDRKSDPRFVTPLPNVLQHNLVWIDTSDCKNSREEKKGKKETWNNSEVEAIIRLLEMISRETTLIDSFLLDEDAVIGVICMYKEQKHRLERAFAQVPFEEKFRRMVRIDTVDAYQGKQNLIVITSLVRSNSHVEVGHVRSPNRCNVALSRARERLYIVGSLPMWLDARNVSPMRQVAGLIRGVGGGGAGVVIPSLQVQ